MYSKPHTLITISTPLRMCFPVHTHTSGRFHLGLLTPQHPASYDTSLPPACCRVLGRQSRDKHHQLWCTYPMVTCIAINCTNTTKNGHKGGDKQIKFHTIPKDIHLRKKWITSIKRKDPPLTDKSAA